MSFVPVTVNLLDRTKNSIIYWDTSVTPLGDWPAKPQYVPASGEFQLINMNDIEELPELKHVLLRVWSMLGTPNTGQTAVPNIGTTFKPYGSTMIAGSWATQAHGPKERQVHELWVPVFENKFEYATDYGTIPGCSYGINIEWLGYTT